MVVSHWKWRALDNRRCDLLRRAYCPQHRYAGSDNGNPDLRWLSGITPTCQAVSIPYAPAPDTCATDADTRPTDPYSPATNPNSRSTHRYPYACVTHGHPNTCATDAHTTDANARAAHADPYPCAWA